MVCMCMSVCSTPEQTSNIPQSIFLSFVGHVIFNDVLSEWPLNHSIEIDFSTYLLTCIAFKWTAINYDWGYWMPCVCVPMVSRFICKALSYPEHFQWYFSFSSYRVNSIRGSWMRKGVFLLNILFNGMAVCTTRLVWWHWLCVAIIWLPF
jgi:hypothetical protein